MSMIGNYRRISRSELKDLLATPESLSDLLFEQEPPPGMSLDIDKAWHAIHFLLNGEPWEGYEPLGHIVLGGTEISDEDVGYGPARYLEAKQVKALSKALAKIDSQMLWSRFDKEAFDAAEIYPGFEGSEEDKEYICENFEALRAFFKEAADNKDVVILYLN